MLATDNQATVTLPMAPNPANVEGLFDDRLSSTQSTFLEIKAKVKSLKNTSKDQEYFAGIDELMTVGDFKIKRLYESEGFSKEIDLSEVQFYIVLLENELVKLGENRKSNLRLL